MTAAPSIACERDGARSLYTLRRGSEALGFIAIDSTVAGRARGGLRMVADVSAAELRAAGARAAGAASQSPSSSSG